MLDALCVELPALIKARTESDGRRMVEVEASNESVDREGDVILQAALLGSAEAFLRSGHLDIDHKSEIGYRMGIANPTSYIVGRPVEVKDVGGGRTSVVGEVMRATDGSFDPTTRKYDELWASLQTQPPVAWRASIYGFPIEGQLIDARITKCAEAPDARRYVVKAIEWKSLAFTLSPINDAIKGVARIVSAKAFAARMMQGSEAQKSGNPGEGLPIPPAQSEWLLPPRNREELLGHYTWHIQNGRCPYAGPEAPLGRSVAAFREHFSFCCCCDPGEADFRALAMMQLLKHYAKV